LALHHSSAKEGIDHSACHCTSTAGARLFLFSSISPPRSHVRVLTRASRNPVAGRPRTDQPGGAQNSLMGSKPGHPFWLWVRCGCCVDAGAHPIRFDFPVLFFSRVSSHTLAVRKNCFQSLPYDQTSNRRLSLRIVTLTACLNLHFTARVLC
jgi:hypothetical protein